MSFVIFALEVWLLIRQTDKYIIPTLTDPENTKTFFQVVFQNTSNFWLMLSFGVAMFFYCLQFRDSRKRKWLFIATLVASAISLVFVAFMPFEFKYSDYSKPSKLPALIFLIIFYCSVFLFDVATIFATIYRYKGGKNPNITSVIIISLFALVCLVFGAKVSYSDFASMRGSVPNPDYKQIICFLMMSIYVGCLLIWKPYISVGILGVVFLGFYILLDKTVSPRVFPEGDQVNYLTFFISLTMVCISIYDQRLSEAEKDEELEVLATQDVLTGLYSFEYFTTLVTKKIKEENIKESEYVYIFINITDFKILNDQRGFEEGNKFLKHVGDILTNNFENALITRQSDDHYVIFTKAEKIEPIIDIIDNQIEKLDLDTRPGIKAGLYLFRDALEDPHLSVEKARYACEELEKKTVGSMLYYDQQMHDNYRLVQYVVTHLDEAIEEGYIRPYYQPVAWSNDGHLCGVEALCRWIDPRHGFMNPGQFIPAIENAQLVYKLDLAMLRAVCKDLRYNIDNKLPVVPCSINFSRFDFEVMDIVKAITELVDEYKIPHDLLHVEITESALMNDENVLKGAMKRLHENGFAIWLDDFGSGYSSFNSLKDFEFDVLKLDMEFLKGFSSNEKAKLLISSVIEMAKKVGIRTLCEGVETNDQSAFLKEVECERQQGYLFGKPLSYDDLMAKIKNKELVVSNDLFR